MLRMIKVCPVCAACGLNTTFSFFFCNDVQRRQRRDVGNVVVESKSFGSGLDDDVIMHDKRPVVPSDAVGLRTDVGRFRCDVLGGAM